MPRTSRLRLIAGAVLGVVLMAITPISQAAKTVGGSAATQRAASRFRVAGHPMRSITLTDFRQFAALSIPDFVRLKADGFNMVTVNVYRSVSDVYANSQSSGPFTEPDASLGATVQAAHAVGLAVQLAPTVWVGTGTGHFVWRAHVMPSDPVAFFDSYREMVNHYADLATQYGVDLLGVGSEMLSLEGYSDAWRQVIGEARQHYHGPITYFTVPATFSRVRWWNAVDYPAVSVYMPMSTSLRPSYDVLVNAWRLAHLPLLRKLARQVRRPLLVSEIGYASTPGAASHPELQQSGVPDESLQADLYRAFVNVALRDTAVLDGVSFFRWSAYETGPLNGGYSPKGKTTECVLARAWAPSGTSAAQCASAGRVVS